MTLFKKCLRLSQIHDLCISRWKNLIFSEGQPRKIIFLIFLPSSILLEAMKKKLATSSFPRYFYTNLPDVISTSLFRPSRLSVHPSVCPWFRHKNFFSPNQQMLLIDVVTYASVMTKMCSASSRDPPGALGGPKRARGVTPKVSQMKKCY